MKGVVIRSTGSSYYVRNENLSVVECKLKGNFRIKGLKATNPVVVGDNIEYVMDDNQNVGLITHITPRSNYIIRKSTKLSKVVNILAANIDKAYLVATIAYPRTSTGFIDRFLVTAEAYKIPAVIIFNKSDLDDEKIFAKKEALMKMYQNIGYNCLSVSALKNSNIELLKKELKDKISLLTGHSGVGKSALINAIAPDLNLRTGEISAFHKKGMHTTTFAEMIPLSFGGYIIDTPGIKEFGLVDFYKEELTHYFPEMFNLLKNCKFNNCTHINEPGCAVLDALEKDKIPRSRYINYLNMFYGRELEDTYE